MTTVDQYLLECASRFHGDFEKISAAFMKLAATIDGGKWHGKARDHFSAASLKKKHEALVRGSTKTSDAKTTEPKVDRFAALLDKLPKMDFSPSDSSEGEDASSPGVFQAVGGGFGGVPMPMRAVDPYGRTSVSRKAAEERRDALGIADSNDEESDEDEAKHLREEVRRNYGPSVWSPRKGVPFFLPEEDKESSEDESRNQNQNQNQQPQELSGTETPVDAFSPAGAPAFIPPERPAPEVRYAGVSVLASTGAARRGFVDPFSPDFDVTVHLSAEERAFFAAECERRRQAMGSRMNFGLIREPEHQVTAEHPALTAELCQPVVEVTSPSRMRDSPHVVVEAAEEEEVAVKEADEENAEVANAAEKKPAVHFRVCDSEEFGACWSFGMSSRPTAEEAAELSETLKLDDLAALQLYRGRVYVGTKDATLKRPKVVADETVLRTTLQRQQAFTAEQLRTEDGSDLAVVCLVQGSEAAAVKQLLMMTSAAGLYLSGFRVAYVTATSVQTAPTSSLLQATKKGSSRVTLACFRGPKAAEAVRDIVGPSDPKLALSTDPDSLNAKFGKTVALPPPATANMSLAEALWGWSNSSEGAGDACASLLVLPRQTVTVTVRLETSDAKKFATALATLVQRAGTEMVSVVEEGRNFTAVVVREAASGAEAKAEIVRTLGLEEAVPSDGAGTGEGASVEMSESPVKDGPEVVVVGILQQAALRMNSCVDVVAELLSLLPEADILSVKATGKVRMGADKLAEALTLGFRRGHGAAKTKLEQKTVLLVSLRGFELVSKVRRLAAHAWRHPAFVGGDVFFTESHAAALQIHRLFMCRVSGDPVRLGSETTKFLPTAVERKNWFGEPKTKQVVAVSGVSAEVFGRLVHRLGSLDVLEVSTDLDSGRVLGNFRGPFAIRKAHAVAGHGCCVEETPFHSIDEAAPETEKLLTKEKCDTETLCDMFELLDKEKVKLRGIWLQTGLVQLAVEATQLPTAKQLLTPLGFRGLSLN